MSTCFVSFRNLHRPEPKFLQSPWFYKVTCQSLFSLVFGSFLSKYPQSFKGARSWNALAWGKIHFLGNGHPSKLPWENLVLEGKNQILGYQKILTFEELWYFLLLLPIKYAYNCLSQLIIHFWIALHQWKKRYYVIFRIQSW